VTRALDTVEEHLHEQVQRPSPGAAGGVRTSGNLLDEILSAAPGDADVSVRNVDGVVDVIDRLGEAPADGRRDEVRGLLAQLAREGDQDR